MSATRYGAILADPPWSFDTYSAKGKDRSPERHYPVLSSAIIAAMPVAEMYAAPDCCLFLWATYPRLPDALDVMRGWGFTYKTVAFTWAKLTRLGRMWHWGTGYWTRANAEICLLGTRGHPKRLSASVPQLLVAPVREHSRKPDEARARVRELVAGPYLELFARERAAGWDVELSPEADKFAEAA